MEKYNILLLAICTAAPLLTFAALGIYNEISEARLRRRLHRLADKVRADYEKAYGEARVTLSTCDFACELAKMLEAIARSENDAEACERLKEFINIGRR